MGIHQDHILTTNLKKAYHYLLGTGELSEVFDVEEQGPRPMRDVRFYYAGKRSWPFAFIVNSGERKDYHLFYLRHPKPGHKELAEERFGPDAVNVNPKGEVTIQIKNQEDAEKVWQLMDEARLK